MKNRKVSRLYKFTNLLLKRLIKYSLLSLFDFFNKGFGYHAAAITFFTLMSLVPFFVVLTVIISYFFSSNVDFFMDIVNKFFPSITQDFVSFALKLSNNKAIFGFFSFFISFFFATNIFTSMYTAFGYIFEGKTSIKKSVFIRFFAIPLFMFILIALYISNLMLSTIIEIVMSFKLWVYLEKFFGFFHIEQLLNLITDISIYIQFLTYFLMTSFIYSFLLPVKIKFKTISIVSLIISILLYALKMLFSVYIVISSKANPIYASLSGIFAFLTWLYISYGTILFGGRILFYLHKDN